MGLLGPVLVVVGCLLAAALVLVGLVVVGVRWRWPFVLRSVFAMQRRLANPSALAKAGQPGSQYSIMRCAGRKSGRIFETPVGAIQDEDGFLVSLPYGSSPQWVRNVLAAGSAVLVHDGHEVPVDQPAVIPLAGVLDRFASGNRRMFGLFGVKECLRLRKAG